MTKISFLTKIFLLLLSLSACSGSLVADKSGDLEGTIPNDARVDGELIVRDGNQMVIQQEDGSELRLVITSQSEYWEGIAWMMSTPAVVGDRITAFGKLRKDESSFEVDRYYANLVELQGIVFYVCGETEAFMVNQPGQEYVIIPLPQKTELLTESPADPTSYKYFLT